MFETAVAELPLLFRTGCSPSGGTLKGLVAAMHECLGAGVPAVLVRVAEARGSTPREAGAAMVVTRETTLGTVGGGALEQSGIDTARAMIESGTLSAALDIPLGPAIAQCCGGHVTLDLRAVDAGFLASEAARESTMLDTRPSVLVFGAGHTGRALASALALLPFKVRVVDARPEALLDLPTGIEARAAALPEAEVEAAPAGAAFLVMTHDHALDFLIAAAALERRDAAYVGMIGSATKRERFRRHLADQGSEALISGLTLPIGGSAVRDKRPEVIAAMTAAELVRTLLSKPRGKTAASVCEAGAAVQ